MAGMKRQMGPRPKVKKGTMKRLLKMLFSDYKWQMLLIVCCLIISAIGSSVSSIFLQRIIDNVITPALASGFDSVKAEFLKIIITLASIYLLAVISSLTYNQIGAKVTQNFLGNVRERCFKKMEKLPISYFDSHAHGDIMSYYTNDVDSLEQLIGQTLPNFISSAITLIVLVSIMCTFSLWLILVVFLSVVLMLFVTKKVGGNSAKYFIKQQKSIAKCEGFIEEMMNGQKVVKVFNHEDESIADFKVINNQLFEDSSTANKFANILMPIMGNIGNIVYVLLAFVGGILIALNVPNLTILGIGGAITTGTLVSFLTMSKSFTMNVSQISQQVNNIVMALAGADRIFTLLDEEEEKDNGYVMLVNVEKDNDGKITEVDYNSGHWAWKHQHKDGRLTYTDLNGRIELENVTFGYTPQKMVLKNVSVVAEAGEKIALVGATGAGKTTIANLVNRFYDIQGGKIRYDGINVTKIKKPDLRRSLAMVLQDTNLFTGTVMDNIRYGNLEATDEMCVEAAKLANAHDFIMRLPNGYNTELVNDGANLSQGQRQLLSIARAAVANAPVLILDEATSSIDTRTEKIVQAGMDALMKGRTVFVIAHRLSTIQNSSKIIVLDNGEILEIGNHEELISKKGRYYQLYTGVVDLD